MSRVSFVLLAVLLLWFSASNRFTEALGVTHNGYSKLQEQEILAKVSSGRGITKPIKQSNEGVAFGNGTQGLEQPKTHSNDNVSIKNGTQPSPEGCNTENRHTRGVNGMPGIDGTKGINGANGINGVAAVDFSAYYSENRPTTVVAGPGLVVHQYHVDNHGRISIRNTGVSSAVPAT